VIAPAGHSPAPDPRSRRARVATLVLTSIVVVSLVPLGLETAAAVLRGDLPAIPFFLVFLLLPANLGLVGAVLTTRRPENVIGWLLLVAGVLAGVSFTGGEYERSVFAAGGDWPMLVPAAWLASVGFLPAIGILVVFLPLYFPTGHLLSPRWRWVVVAGILGVTAGALGAAVAAGPMGDPRGPLNPLVPPEPLATWIAAVSTLSNYLAPPVFLLALASLLIRFRRSHDTERQQIKWFLFVAAVATGLFGVSVLDIGAASNFAWGLGLMTMACLPLAIGLAILRYHLYDIDRVVSRAV